MEVGVPHALDGPEHGAACYLLGRDLVNDPEINVKTRGPRIHRDPCQRRGARLEETAVWRPRPGV